MEYGRFIGNIMKFNSGTGNAYASGARQSYVVRKFGLNSDVDAGEEMITTLGKSMSASVHPDCFLTAATTVRVKAGGNANDTAAGSRALTLTIEGLDENWLPARETVDLAGASASASTTTTFIRVFRAYIGDTVGTYGLANEGAITLENTAGTIDLLQIPAGAGQTEEAWFTVSAGYTAFINHIDVGVDGTKTANLKCYFVDNTVTDAGRRTKLNWPGIGGFNNNTLGIPLKVTEKTDIIWTAGSSSNGLVSVEFDLFMVPNELLENETF